ncbi:SDR family oxidoreductase [candidate division KSB1 bacterium]|nr:SDR family oxidoreductase [candidate division KSB1 bacterium]
MAVSLKNKIVLITGASAGIGEACAKAFAAEGSKLILAARRIDRLRALSKELDKEHNTISLVLKLDVRNSNQVSKILGDIPADWQNIDILINNAGLSQGLDKVQDGLFDNWDIMIDTNIKGLLYVTRIILPGMIKRESGHVVNIGSIAGYLVYPSGNVYCATKHAVRALTEGMQMDVVDTPIRISAVSPGLVETEFSLVRFKGDAEKAKNVYKGIHPLTGNDIAEAIVFCVTRPTHVNINDLIIMPTSQASAMVVHRDS